MLFFRSSQQRCSVKKGVLKNFVKLTGKHLYQSLFFNKVAGLKLWHRCFPVNFAKFLRTTFLKKNSVRLLLVFQFTSIIISKRWQRRLSIGTKKISCNKIRVIMPSLFLLKKVFNMICYYSFLTATTWIRFLQSVIFYEYLNSSEKTQITSHGEETNVLILHTKENDTCLEGCYDFNY